jgi:vacuolar-type H+-ATPase subunit E/Vma4
MQGDVMKTVDYKRLKKEAEEQYQQALDKAQKDRLEALDAIERVWGMINPRRSKAASGTTSATQYGSLAGMVQKALELVPQTFTKKDVLAAMRQISSEVAASCNSNSLSGCLHRLKKGGVIVEIEKGQGSAPTKYELASKNTDVNETSNEQITDQ